MKIITPLAQSFFIDAEKYPNGITLTSIILYFRKRDDTNAPITLDVRPLNNGYPDNKVVYDGSTVTLYSTQVRVKSGISSSLPLIGDAMSETEFRFSTPLILMPGSHCFCITTNSSKYEIFSSKLGDKSLITDKLVVSRHEYSESLFRSSNSSTFTAEQSENLMYRINIARFDRSKVGHVVFEPYNPLAENPTSLNTGMHEYQHYSITASNAVPSNTYINYFTSHLPATADDSDPEETTYVHSPINQTNDLSQSMLLNNNAFGGDSGFSMIASLMTKDTYVTPIIDHSTTSLITVSNFIGPGDITDTIHLPILDGGTGYGPTLTIGGANTTPASGYCIIVNGVIVKVIIVDGGTGYSSATVSLTGNVTGTGATFGTPVVESGSVVSIEVTNGGSGYGPYITVSLPDFSWGIPYVCNGLIIGYDPQDTGPFSNDMKNLLLASGNVVTGYYPGAFAAGTGYANAPTVTIHNEGTGTGLTIGTNYFEDGIGAGPGVPKFIAGTSVARYVTKPITLNYSADSMRVILDANLPKETAIKLYIKPYNSEDQDQIDNKKWIEIPNKSPIPSHDNFVNFNEIEYHISNISYENNAKTYYGYDMFKVKIVMYSTNPVNIPRVRNLRMIALR